MRALLIIPVVLLAACTRTSVTDTSKTTALISTSAAPICMQGGAVATANQMAAITTLRKGYKRYTIGSAGTQSNVRAIRTGPTYADTYINAGGGLSTSLGGSSTVITGRHNAQVHIRMFNPGDRGYGNAIDAKRTLGKNWEQKVKQGLVTCF